MAYFPFEDPADYAPDEFTADGAKYRRDDLPMIVTPSIHLFPPNPPETPTNSQTLSIFPTTHAVTFTPETYELNGRTYRKIE